MNKWNHKTATKTLWIEFLNGNNSALEKLYEKLFPKLFLICYSRMKDKEKSKDIVQESFLKILENDIEKNRGINNVEGWLINSIKFMCRTEYRSNNTKRKHLAIYKTNYSLNYLDYSNIDITIVKKIIDRFLPPLNIQILHLASCGYKNSEIASELGLSERQVRNRKHQSKKKVKEIIEQEQF